MEHDCCFSSWIREEKGFKLLPPHTASFWRACTYIPESPLRRRDSYRPPNGSRHLDLPLDSALLPLPFTHRLLLHQVFPSRSHTHTCIPSHPPCHFETPPRHPPPPHHEPVRPPIRDLSAPDPATMSTPAAAAERRRRARAMVDEDDALPVASSSSNRVMDESALKGGKGSTRSPQKGYGGLRYALEPSQDPHDATLTTRTSILTALPPLPPPPDLEPPQTLQPSTAHPPAVPRSSSSSSTAESIAKKRRATLEPLRNSKPTCS